MKHCTFKTPINFLEKKHETSTVTINVENVNVNSRIQNSIRSLEIEILVLTKLL